MIEENKVYSARALAAELGVGKDKIYRWAKQGKMPSTRIDEHSPLRFTGWSIKAWLDTKTHKPVEGEST